MELMFFIFSEFCKHGNNLILESNFHKKELEMLHNIANKNDYEVLTIVLRGNVEVLHKRYLNRIYNENRHPVHLSTTLDVFSDFKEYIECSRKEEVIGKTININANSFLYQTDRTILTTIDEFMKD